jgi:predicted ArsR family transcriptional regulator
MAPKTNTEKDQRILDLVKDNEGIRVYELCQQMPMPNNQLRPRLERLFFEGKIHFKKEPGVCRIYSGKVPESK